MGLQSREKFEIEINAGLLSAIRTLAASEGREIQALVDEALTDLLEKRKHGQPRAKIMATYQASHEKFRTLYENLAE